MSKSHFKVNPGDLICTHRGPDCHNCPHVNPHQPVFIHFGYRRYVPCSAITNCSARDYPVSCIPADEYVAAEEHLPYLEAF